MNQVLKSSLIFSELLGKLETIRSITKVGVIYKEYFGFILNQSLSISKGKKENGA